MATKYLSDGEVFGSSGYLSEDEVFGASGDAAPPGAQSTGIRQDLPAGIAPSTAGGGRGSINPPMAAERQPVRTQAKQPTPYRDRREALDDAVNLLEEGADQKAVTETFSKGGIKFDEIVEHGRKRGSEYFKQQAAPTVYPEVTRPANRYPTPVTGEIKSTRPDTPLPGADVLLAGAKGVVGGFKMLMSAGGAGGKPTSAAEKAIKTADLYLEGLRSAAAIKDDDRIGQIMEEAKDGTWADQVAAAAKAAGVAPASLVAQGLGTSVPVILATLLPGVRESTVARLTAQIGLGAAQGAGATKESIYNAVKDDMLRAGVPKFEAEERAEAAQSYLGQNKDQIAVGMALGALASSTGVEKVIPVGQVSKVMAKSGVSRAVASAEQNVIGRGLIGGLTEAVPEFAQGSADQVAQNVALQREGRDVPTFQGAVGQGALEAIAGFGAGAVTNAAFGRPQTAADQLARELDVSIANTDLTSADPTLISTSQTLRQPNDAGPSAPSRNVSFTPADSPTAQAGLVPIVVGIPSATPAATQSGAIPPINPNAGQEFGLDALETGLPNVSTPGTAGTEIAAGSIAGSDQQRGGVGPARSDLAGAGGLDVPGASVNARNDGQAVASGSDARQLAASLTRPKLAARATDQDLLARTESAIAAAESSNAAPQPVEQWVGRKGDGYLTEADAAQALPGRQRMFPALAWEIEQMPGGKFRLAGYEQQSSQLAPIVGTTEERAGASLPTQAAITTPSGKPFSTEKTAAVYAQQNGITDYSTVKIDGGWAINPTETTLGNQTTQAIKGQTQGQQAPAIGGAAGSGLFQAMDRGSAAQAQGGEDVGVSAMAAGPDTQPGRPGALSTPEGARDAGINAPLRLAPPAPIRAVGNAITALKRDAGVSAKADTSPMTDRQQAASAVARMLGRTVTYLKADTPASIPNGFMVAGDSKNIFIASDSEDAPLSVAMHEIYHTLPELQRKALNKQLTQYFRQDRREEFANRFDYDPKNDSLLDEEISAFMVQAISKREDFWQDLRTKMGNKEFSEVAKTILAKLNAIIGGANTAYGDGFVSRYISDVVKARDLLTDAYAQAMRDQGVAPDVAAANAAIAPLADQAAAEMGVPDMGQQGSAPSDYVDRLTQDIDLAEQALSAIKGINLFSNLGKLKLTAEDWREIGTLPAFSRGGASARKLVDRVADGLFDEYLPFDMRHDSARFDEKESTEYIKDALRSWKKGAAYYPFTVRMEMAQLDGQIAELTAELNQEIQLDDINKEIASIADELAREAASNVTQQEDTNGDLAEAQGSSPQEGLTSYSPKEIDALEKARSKREADQRKADAEADQRAQADAERDTFALTGSDRAADVGAAMGQGDIFSSKRSGKDTTKADKDAKYMDAVERGDMVDVIITEDRDEDTLYAVTATSPSSDKAFVTAEAGADGSFQIQESGVPQMDQGKGLGVRLYEGLIRNLFDRGTITVTSDSSVSADAQRVYKALERRGYAVTQNQSAKIDEETGAMESPGVEPVFTVQDKKLDKAEGDIRFSNRRQKLSTIGQNYTLPATSLFDAGRIKLQDDSLRMKRVIEAVKNQGGTVGEAQNFYDAITLMPGRVQVAMEDFRDKAIRPLIDKAVKFGVDLDELALYAYAKHAEERNDYISSINNRFPDGGSGMTNADADVLIAKAKDEGKAAKFEELHRDLMAITATTRQVMLTEGLINQDEFDALDSAYENYIPLRGLENVDESTGAIRPGVGRGINVRGGETIRAMGRRSRASDLIENVIRDYERVITRVDRNDTGKVLLDFVLSNPDPDLWGVDVERSKPSLNKVTGLVQYTKSIEKGEDTIGVKVGGEQVYIKFADKDLTRALRQAWRDETSGLERATLAMTGWWNNWMRNVLTRYNPAFAALNIPRDALWSGTTAALAELGPKGLTRYLANYGKALMASIRQEAGVTGTDNKIIGNRQMDRAFQEFRSAGSITGGFYMRSLDDINKDLRNEMLLAGAKSKTTFEAIKSLPPYKLATLTARMLEFMGSASENATRFALYQAARDVGKTPAQAALLAKDGTTNFNRKGEWGGALNNLYLFFNAAVQGNAQLAKVLKSPAVQASMAGVTGVGFMLAMLGASAGGEDDDGEAYWDKIPSHVKERNLVFMLPPGDALADSIERAGKRGRYFTVPVQYGFNIFPNIGYMMADVMRNAQDTRRGVTPTKAALHMTSTVFGSINPLGGAIDFSDGVQVLLAAMPTLADLPIQLVNERGTFGAPSAPQKSPWDNRPDSERMFTSQEGTVPAKIAKMLNEMGSGNEGKGGTMLGMDTSVTPGTIQTLISATTGGLGSFAEQVGSSVIAMTNDNKDLKAAKIPFLNKFYGEVDESANIRIASDRARKIGQLSSEVKAQQEFGIEAALTKEEQKLVDMANDQERFQKELSGLRKEEMEIIADEKLTPAEKTLRRRMIQVERDKAASEFNKEFFKSAK